MSEKQSEEISR